MVAVARHAAMPEVPMATFSSDNRMLNAVWRLTARSCLYCSQEQFVDTPTREKGQFVWDAANESEAIMRAYGDQNMSWQGLRDVARGQARYWPDGRVNAVYPNGDGARSFGTFTARYPEWLWRYYLSTGDRATALAHYTSVTKVADWLWGARQGTTGLLYGLADTSNGDPVYGYDLSVAADTASNVLAVNAFNRVAQLAGLAGDAGGAAVWQARAAQLTATINAVLRRGDGVYVDGVGAGGTPSGHASQEANALALAYGVVPAANTAAVGAYVAGLGIDVGPNHGLELLRALAAADLPHAVVHTLTDASDARVGPHRGRRRDLHLGDLVPERPDRGLHVARLGLVRARRHAGDPARRLAGGARHRRHGAAVRHSTLGRARAGFGVGADDRGAGRGVLGAAGQRPRPAPRPRCAGQRVRGGAAARDRCVERPRGRHRGGQRPGRARHLGRGRGRRPERGQRELSVHQRVIAQ